MQRSANYFLPSKDSTSKPREYPYIFISSYSRAKYPRQYPHISITEEGGGSCLGQLTEIQLYMIYINVYYYIIISCILYVSPSYRKVAASGSCNFATFHNLALILLQSKPFSMFQLQSSAKQLLQFIFLLLQIPDLFGSLGPKMHPILYGMASPYHFLKIPKNSLVIPIPCQ